MIAGNGSHGVSIKYMCSRLDEVDKDGENDIWKHTWNIKVQECIKSFVWLLWHDRLLTNHQEYKRLGKHT